MPSQSRHAARFLLLLLSVTLPAWGQGTTYRVPAASVEDQFSGYHAVLNSAAEKALARAGGEGDWQTPMPQPRPQPIVNSDSSLLRQFAQQYWNGQEENVRRAVDRIAQLRLTLDPILHEEGVPADIAAITLVESGGRVLALSPKGALGLWQLMPDTARRYGLVVSPTHDERIDVAKATRAAARYLRDLYARFGDWDLAFAAYNSGEQTVQRALARSRARDFSTLSRGLMLPQETRNYVPAVRSAVRLFRTTSQDVASANQFIGAAGVTYAELSQASE